MDVPTDIDVAIVGAGPTGLLAGCFLQKAGISTITLDAKTSPATTSRANILHIKSLDILRKLDLDQQFIQEGQTIEDITSFDKDKRLFSVHFTNVHEHYKHALSLPQVDSERLLTAKYLELGGSIHRGCTVTKVLEADDSYVHLTVQLTESSAHRLVAARYVVASDGWKSVVRQSLGIPFEGDEYGFSFITADIRIDPAVWSHHHLRHSLMEYMGSAGWMIAMPFPSQKEDLWRVIAAEPIAPKQPSLTYLDNLIRARGPQATDAPIVQEVVWSGHFRTNHRLAQQFRKGRVFLAGDAAHTHSPIGGQGMNVGFGDAEYVSSVITDAVLTGRDSKEQLDRYEKARRPVAKDVASMTHRLTMAATSSNALFCWFRNWMLWLVPRLIPGVTTQIARDMSGLTA